MAINESEQIAVKAALVHIENLKADLTRLLVGKAPRESSSGSDTDAVKAARAEMEKAYDAARVRRRG